MGRNSAARLAVVLTVTATSGLWTQVAPKGTEHSPHQHTMPTFFVGETMIQPGPSDPNGQVGSGGSAVAHYAGAKKITKKKVTKMAPDARLFRTGYGTFEPTMGITQDGTILINALTQGGPAIIGSENDGESWDMMYDGHVTTNDPYLYVDPTTSRIFANDLILPCHFNAISDDGGDTWTEASPAGCGYNADHQTIFAGPPPEGGAAPDEYPNVVYLCSIGDGASLAAAGTTCSKSLDGGMTFLPAGTQPYTNDPLREGGDAGIPGACNGAHGHGFVGPDGTVYLPRGWCGQPYIAISEDEGLSWTRVQVADNGMPFVTEIVPSVASEVFSHEAGVVADGLGNVYYTWVAGDRLPYLAISHDRGLTWDAPMMIGPPGLKEALLPGIAMGKAGRVVVHYMGSTNSPWDGSNMAADPSATRWNAYMTMTVSALAKRPVFYSAAINHPSEPLWVGPCGPDPSRCGWGDFFDVVVGIEGDPWAVAVDLCNEVECGGLGEAIIGRLAGGPKLN